MALRREAAPSPERDLNRLLTQLRAVDGDLHDKLLPYVQRRANVANRVLAIAERQAKRHERA
jgi:hypothetical protein